MSDCRWLSVRWIQSTCEKNIMLFRVWKKDFDYPLFHLVTITYYYQYILTKFVQVKILSLGIQGIILFVLFFFKDVWICLHCLFTDKLCFNYLHKYSNVTKHSELSILGYLCMGYFTLWVSLGWIIAIFFSRILKFGKQMHNKPI